MKKILPYLAAAVLAVGLGAASYNWLNKESETQQRALRTGGYTGGDFTLDSFEGKLSLSDFKGQPVLIYFGYTSCPDVCPNSLAIMGEAMKILGDEQPVKGLLVSIDPDRDTLEKLHNYGPFFHPNITGVRGNQYEILEVGTRYGVYHKKVEDDGEGNYLVDHTSRIYLIDENTELADVINHGASATEVAQRVRMLY